SALRPATSGHRNITTPCTKVAVGTARVGQAFPPADFPEKCPNSRGGAGVSARRFRLPHQDMRTRSQSPEIGYEMTGTVHYTSWLPSARAHGGTQGPVPALVALRHVVRRELVPVFARESVQVPNHHAVVDRHLADQFLRALLARAVYVDVAEVALQEPQNGHIGGRAHGADTALLPPG